MAHLSYEVNWSLFTAVVQRGLPAPRARQVLRPLARGPLTPWSLAAQHGLKGLACLATSGPALPSRARGRVGGAQLLSRAGPDTTQSGNRGVQALSALAKFKNKIKVVTQATTGTNTAWTRQGNRTARIHLGRRSQMFGKQPPFRPTPLADSLGLPAQSQQPSDCRDLPWPPTLPAQHLVRGVSAPGKWH